MRMRYDQTAERQQQLAISFFHGWIAKSIEEFAQRINLPASELAGRLAELLSATESGQVLGLEHRLSRVPHQAPQESAVLEPMAVALEPYRSGTPVAPGGGAGAFQKSYWAKMTKEERSAEMKRRMSLWSKDAKRRWQHKLKNKSKGSGDTPPLVRW